MLYLSKNALLKKTKKGMDYWETQVVPLSHASFFIVLFDLLLLLFCYRKFLDHICKKIQISQDIEIKFMTIKIHLYFMAFVVPRKSMIGWVLP